MQPGKFRKLDIDLPVQRTYNPKPWFVTGLLFALLILLITAYAYLEHKGIKLW